MIRWVTDSLGTAAFEFAAQDTSGAYLVDVRDLVDKGGNLPSLAQSKVEESLAQLRAGRKVVICCDYGMSRSNAVAVGVLALNEKVSFSDAVRQVRRATGEHSIKVEVLAAVRAALEGTPDAAPLDRPQRILLTGGSGAIGKTLLQRMPFSRSVIAPSRAELDLLAGAVDLDLCIKDHGIDVLVHLANPRVFTTNEAMGQMVVMMKNVLDACRENRIRLVYLSEWEVYAGYRSSGLLASEELPRHPAGTVGHAKYLCEILLEQYHRETGLAYTIVRASPVYGEASERPRFIWNFLQKALRGDKIVAHRYRNGFPHLDLLDIDDLVDALIGVMATPQCGAFNIGAGQGVSTTRVAEIIRERTGSQSPIEHREIDGLAPNIVMDSTRARTLLGWEPKVDFRDGLQKLVAAHMRRLQFPKEVNR